MRHERGLPHRSGEDQNAAATLDRKLLVFATVQIVGSCELLCSWITPARTPKNILRRTLALSAGGHARYQSM